MKRYSEREKKKVGLSKESKVGLIIKKSRRKQFKKLLLKDLPEDTNNHPFRLTS